MSPFGADSPDSWLGCGFAARRTSLAAAATTTIAIRGAFLRTKLLIGIFPPYFFQVL
jgi:hypothetical protein